MIPPVVFTKCGGRCKSEETNQQKETTDKDQKIPFDRSFKRLVPWLLLSPNLGSIMAINDRWWSVFCLDLGPSPGVWNGPNKQIDCMTDDRSIQEKINLLISCPRLLNCPLGSCPPLHRSSDDKMHCPVLARSLTYRLCIGVSANWTGWGTGETI